MIYGSVCSGIEAATQAWAPLGWQAKFFSEIEAFPSAVLAHHYGSNMPGEELAKNGVPNHGDFTKIPDSAGPIDLLVGGTPCFPGHVLIATRRGLVPIRDVVVGDEVLTHKNRWKTVLATGSKTAKTIRVVGQGQSSGIQTTHEHPFYVRQQSWKWVGRENGSRVREFSDPRWVDAERIGGMHWASPTRWPSDNAPPIKVIGRESGVPSMTGALAWVIGRWLGDGWCRINKRRGYVLICSSFDEESDMRKGLEAANVSFSVSYERTTCRFQIASRPLARWLSEEFGSGSFNKTMPTWIFGWPLREQFFQGYLSADGCVTSNGMRLTTVSDKLALGSVLLAHSLGFSASRRLVVTGRSKPMIEGRRISERPFWQVTFCNRSRSSVEIDGHRWGLVRSVVDDEVSAVFNVEVEEDNSYTADGIVVHNCQSFSVAGKRLGLDDPRGNLALEYLRLARRLRARWIVWENVPGVLSSRSDDGTSDFATFLEFVRECGYGFAYRVIDAQYVRVDGFERAVPQRRRRVFLVGYLGDWRRAAAVLLEPEGMRGDSPPRRKAGEGVAGSVTASAGRRGGTDDPEREKLIPQAFGGGNTSGAIDVSTALAAHGHRIDFEVETFVAHSLRAEGFDASEDGTGRGTPIVPVVSSKWAVRRLMPVECERLMGFSDGYTNIPWRGKDHAPDGPRYKSLGNSFAVNVCRWIGQRIDMMEKLIQAGRV